MDGWIRWMIKMMSRVVNDASLSTLYHFTQLLFCLIMQPSKLLLHGLPSWPNCHAVGRQRLYPFQVGHDLHFTLYATAPLSAYIDSFILHNCYFTVLLSWWKPVIKEFGNVAHGVSLCITNSQNLIYLQQVVLQPGREYRVTAGFSF